MVYGKLQSIFKFFKGMSALDIVKYLFVGYAMAGTGSYTKIDGFAILPVLSFAMALTTFVGQKGHVLEL